MEALDDEIDYYVDRICGSLSQGVPHCRVQHQHFSDRHAKDMAEVLFHRLYYGIPSRLERLSFYRCPRLSYEGVSHIVKALSRLQKLRIKHPRLLQLEISSVQLEDQGIKMICDCLFPSETGNIPLIKSLELEDIGTIKESTWRIFLPRVLDQRYHLETLDLTHNLLNTESIAILAGALETNTSLKNLILSENPKIGDKGVNVLSEALKINHSLNVLSLAVCNVGNKGIKMLVDCLEFNNMHLTKIYLFANPYNHNSPEKARLTYLLDMNNYGRRDVHVGTKEAIIPHILSKPSRKNRSDVLYGLLHQVPHLYNGSSL